jgi:ZIP family zinc transporter
MIFLVVTEFIPEAIDLGRGLPRGGRPELLVGLTAGVAVMVPLLFV